MQNNNPTLPQTPKPGPSPGPKEDLKSLPLEDPARRWKISEADYSEREYWDEYQSAYEDALGKCSKSEAPWFVIPSDHKWFRNLAISQIIVEMLEKLRIRVPEPTVDINDIRKKYHRAVGESEKRRK